MLAENQSALIVASFTLIMKNEERLLSSNQGAISTSNFLCEV